MKNILRILILGFLLNVPQAILAHAPNQSYIFLQINADGIEGRFEITSEDLNQALDLGLGSEIKFQDLSPHIEKIKAFYLERTSFSSENGNHAIVFGNTEIVPIQLGESVSDFIQIQFSLEDTEQVPDQLNIHYDILFDKDPSHLCLQVVEYHWKGGVHNEEANVTLSFGPNNVDGVLDLSGSTVWTGLKAMIKSGMHHIIIGLDHILFLFALLLPGVVTRSGLTNDLGSTTSQFNAAVFPTFLRSYAFVWIPNEKFRSSLFYVIKIVTFFTLAHTITLSLAALQIIKLPGVLVESIIALSIALAALNNIYPMLQEGREWLIAFVFGLFHGFGFASVLADVGLRGDFMTLSLLGFNIGVEVGQILIVLIIFPVLFLLRKTALYRPLLIYGSIFLILVAINWFLDRSFGTDLPLDDFVEKVYRKFLNLIL